MNEPHWTWFRGRRGKWHYGPGRQGERILVTTACGMRLHYRDAICVPSDGTDGENCRKCLRAWEYHQEQATRTTTASHDAT